MRSAILLATSCIALAAGAATASVAHAQGGTPQAQFDYGLAEMEGGRYATGCPALAESYRLDPHPGVLFTLAECENRWGSSRRRSRTTRRTSILFAHMSDAEKGRQRARERVASAQRERLRGEVPQLAIALPPSAPPGTTVSRDGARLGAPSLGVAAPVDPGEHVVVAKTPDGVAHESRVNVARGEHRSLVLDLSAPPPVSPPPPPAGPATIAQPPATATAATGSPLRTWAWVAGGIGLAGLAAGSVAGAIVMGDKSTIDANCHPDKTCNPQGLGAANDASRLGLVSDIAFGVGGAGVVAAVVLLLVAPSSAVQPVAAAQPHGGIVGLRATW